VSCDCCNDGGRAQGTSAGGATNAARGRFGIFACKVKKNTALPSSFAAEMEVKIRKWM
jgi:hypothetical protein